jgi:chymotrypsin
MKASTAAIFAILVASAFADDSWEEIDWSKVVPRTEVPGFWDGKDKSIAGISSGPSRSGRIVGGNIVTPHSHPYQAGLLFRGLILTGMCGGSIITARSVLTAAHCTVGARSLQVILGAHQITTVEPSQQRFNVEVSTFRVHPEYVDSSFRNDVAIIILPSAATLNTFVALVNLPALGTTNSFVGETATATGWGRTSGGSTAGSTHLRSVQNTVITNEACARFSTNVFDCTICTSTTGGRSPCHGDSGGPLTVQSGGRRVQIGVVSFGPSGGCETGTFAAFARVTNFVQWIANNQNP